MNLAIIIAASFRYFEQYNWSKLRLTENWKLAFICADDDKEKLEGKGGRILKTCPVKRIHGEPNGRFSEDDLRPIISELSLSYENIQLISIDEGILHTVARLREEFDLTAQDADDVLLLSDKEKAYIKLSSRSIRVPRFTSETQAFDKIVEHVGCPFILKPVSSSGAFGIRIIEDITAFSSMEKESSQEYIANEFIDGKLYHCDLQFQAGKLVFSSVGEYLNPLSRS
ncbi:ATP-grasp domain-containing protein [Endozoicomonas sp. Mp262]|uniref:ATP-grasp domain-containing protein n=1 Tax=Endozoicomonas sp. Mp262 TaxID=2919499 RepID=UPI0021DA4D5C